MRLIAPKEAGSAGSRRCCVLLNTSMIYDMRSTMPTIGHQTGKSIIVGRSE